MSVSEAIGGMLMLAGTALIALAGIGLLRLPDAYHRINAVAKAGSLGLVAVLLGVACWTAETRTVVVLLPAIAVQLFTAPLVGYVTGRAAHRAGTPLAAELRANELGPPGGPAPADGPEQEPGAGPAGPPRADRA